MLDEERSAASRCASRWGRKTRSLRREECALDEEDEEEGGSVEVDSSRESCRSVGGRRRGRAGQGRRQKEHGEEARGSH